MPSTALRIGGPRKKPSVMISPAASAEAAITQMIQSGMVRSYADWLRFS